MSLMTHKVSCVNPDGSVAWEREIGNMTPDQGASYIMNAVLKGGSQYSSWYIGLYKNPYTPSGSTGGGDIPTNIVEFTDYNESNRPTWNGTVTGLNANNSASPGIMTVTTGTPDTTVYGGFMITSSVKGAGGGTILSITRWSSPETVKAGQVLKVTSEFNLTA